MEGFIIGQVFPQAPKCLHEMTLRCLSEGAGRSEGAREVEEPVVGAQQFHRGGY